MSAVSGSVEINCVTASSTISLGKREKTAEPTQNIWFAELYKADTYRPAGHGMGMAADTSTHLPDVAWAVAARWGRNDGKRAATQ